MNDDTLAIRLLNDEAEKHEEALDRLEDLVVERGIGECASSMALGDVDRVLLIELEPGATFEERKLELQNLVVEVGLSGIAEVTVPETDDGELDDDEDDDENLDDEALEEELLDDDDDDDE